MATPLVGACDDAVTGVAATCCSNTSINRGNSRLEATHYRTTVVVVEVVEVVVQSVSAHAEDSVWPSVHKHSAPPS